MTHVIGRIRRAVRRATPAGARGANSAVRRALAAGGLQAKLKVGAQNDGYEREADQVAARVMAGGSVDAISAIGTDPAQRMCADCEDEAQRMTLAQRQEVPEDEEEMLQAKALRDGVQRQPLDEEEEEEVQARARDDGLQRQPIEEEEEEEIQTKAKADGSFTAGASVAAVVSGLKGGGQPLVTSTRAYFEPRFGADFSDVRVHTGTQARTAAKALNARAFTTGRDVVFGEHEYAPNSRAGGELLAHELAHVIQQRGYKRRPEGAAQDHQVQRWAVGAAPVPQAGWSIVPAAHTARLNAAEAIVRSVLTSRNCRNFFRDNCQNGGGAAALQNAFNNARIYFRNVDDNTFGENPVGSSALAYNQRSFRMGRYFLAATILHEMFHTCDPVQNPNDERLAEDAVERCRLYAPFLTQVNPGSGAVGSRITLRGWGLGPTRGAQDRVELNGVACPEVSRVFNNADSSVSITVTVPAGAATGVLRVINNNVRSNTRRFTVI